MSETSVKALLVEDDPGDVRLIREMLSEAKGFYLEVEPVARLSTAIARLSTQEIDVALIDLSLPDSEGYDTFARINSEVSDIPIILLTGLDDEEMAIRAVREGAQDYIPKSRADGELLSRTIRYAIERKRAEKELRNQTKMAKLISSVSSTLATLSYQEFDRGINEVLCLIGESVNADRCYLFQTSNDGTRMSNTHEWCASGISSEKDNLQDLDTEMFPWWMSKLRYGEVFVVSDVASLDEDATAERDILEAQGIRSLIIVPLMSASGPIGFFGFDAVNQHRQWNESEINVLQTATEIVASRLLQCEATRKLAEREEQLSLVVEHTPDCVFYIRDESDRITYVSPSLETVTGRSLEECTAYATFLTDNPINASARERAEVFRGGNKLSTAYQAEIYHKSGKAVVLEVSEHPIIRDGRVVGRQGVARDITERQALEAQLLHSQKMEAIGRLAGGIAHDFKNLLMGISGYAEIARMEVRRGREPCEEIEGILGCVEKANSLATQLLAFGKRQSVQPRPTDLNALIETCQPLLERLLGEHFSVQFDLSPDAGTANVDPSQIEQVVMNLVINARYAMPQGGEVWVSTRALELAEEDWSDHPGVMPGAYTHMAVADKGIGIDDKIKEHIFEPFFTTKPDGEGTGLGLPVVYGIVTQHNGYIRVESEAGKGTTFHVYLPTIFTAPLANHTHYLGTHVSGSATILLAEDEDAVRQPVCKMLQEYGYTVMATTNGAEAIELFKEHVEEIKLAILDVVMPKIGGTKALEAMREVRPDIKVLFISGYAASEFREQFTPPPDEPILAKPFSLADLTSKVAELLA